MRSDPRFSDLCGDSPSLEEGLEGIVRSSVEVCTRDERVTSLEDSSDRLSLRSLTRAGSNSSDTTLESSHALLQDSD